MNNYLRLFALLAFLSASIPTTAQTGPRSLPRRDRSAGELKTMIKKAMGASVPFNAFFSQEGWVLIDPPRTSGSGIPELALSKIRAYQRAGKRIDIFEIAPNGQWILIADNYRFYSSRSYFDKIGLRPKVEEYLQKGLRFDALAFASTGDWVLVAEDHRYYSTGSGFNRMGLRPVLNELIQAGQHIVDIAINPNNGFVILTDHEYRTKFIPDALKRRLSGLRDKNVTFRAIEFNQDHYLQRKSWLLVAEDHFWAHQFAPNVCEAIEAFVTVGGSCSRGPILTTPESVPSSPPMDRDTKEDSGRSK